MSVLRSRTIATRTRYLVQVIGILGIQCLGLSASHATTDTTSPASVYPHLAHYLELSGRTLTPEPNRKLETYITKLLDVSIANSDGRYRELLTTYAPYRMKQAHTLLSAIHAEDVAAAVEEVLGDPHQIIWDQLASQPDKQQALAEAFEKGQFFHVVDTTPVGVEKGKLRLRFALIKPKARLHAADNDFDVVIDMHQSYQIVDKMVEKARQRVAEHKAAGNKTALRAPFHNILSSVWWDNHYKGMEKQTISLTAIFGDHRNHPGEHAMRKQVEMGRIKNAGLTRYDRGHQRRLGKELPIQRRSMMVQ